jgi:hypothetical protein
VKRLRALARRARHGPGSLVDQLGFPSPRHPESLSRELRKRHEDWLAAAAAGLWPAAEGYVVTVRRDPAGEYVVIVRRDPPEGSGR